MNIKAKEGSNYDNIKSVKVKITVYDASGKNFKGIINPENVCYVNERISHRSIPEMRSNRSFP